MARPTHIRPHILRARPLPEALSQNSLNLTSVRDKLERPFSRARRARENGRFGRSCNARTPKTPLTRTHVELGVTEGGNGLNTGAGSMVSGNGKLMTSWATCAKDSIFSTTPG